MQVFITQFDVGMEIKNSGISLLVRNPDGELRGTLVITKTRLQWDEGQAHVNCKEVKWDKFIKYMESQ